MSRPILRAALVAAAGATFVACPNHLADDPSLLKGPVWSLRALQRVDGTAVPVPEAVFTAQFGDDGRLAVRSDCNTCGGSYEADGDRLRVMALACTRVFCGRTAPVDTDFVVALEAARSYVVTGRVLTLAGERSLVVFER
jgi:heat shock protein HslJ